MALVIPPFRIGACVQLNVCAELVKADASKEVLEWLEAQPFMLAHHRIGDKAGFVVLILGGSDANHVHVDLVTEDACKDREIPDATCKLSVIKKAWEHLSGKSVKARIVGRYLIDVTESPFFIRAVTFQVTKGNVKLKVTGGKVSVEGAPISKIEWSKDEEDNLVTVGLSAHKTLIVGDSYLQDSIGIVDSAFESLIQKGDTT